MPAMRRALVVAMLGLLLPPFGVAAEARHAKRRPRTRHGDGAGSGTEAAEGPRTEAVPAEGRATPQATPTPGQPTDGWVPPLVRENRVTQQHYDALRSAAPRIYVYNLPPDVRGDQCAPHGAYSLEVDLPDTLRENGFTVDDPATADFFWVPALTYCTHKNVLARPGGADIPAWNYTSVYIDGVVRELRRQGPHWDEQPHRHVFVWPADHGFCGFGPKEPGVAQVRESIGISHWGLTKREMGGPHAAACLPQGLPCHVPGKDIVVPTPNDYVDMQKMKPSTEADDSNRTTLLFFAGNSGVELTRGSGTGTHYSHGVRGLIFMMFNDTAKFPRMKLVKRAPDDEFYHSVFCLAPSGGGYGIRLFKMMYFGCIPVIVQDDIRQAYDDLLPYRKFAIVLRSHKLARLRQYLGRAEAKKEPYFAALREHRASLFWEFDGVVPSYPGKALLRLFESLNARKTRRREDNASPCGDQSTGQYVPDDVLDSERGGDFP